MAKLRAELEAILKELQHIMNAKMGLELEIEAYRKLLETEETRSHHNVLYNSLSNLHNIFLFVHQNNYLIALLQT